MPSHNALYVRLPAEEAERLDRAAQELKASKRALITELVSRHLGDLADERRRVVIEPTEPGLVVGHHAFRPHPAPEVLTAAQVAELLQVDESAVLALADAGELPARKIGDDWRFARAAVLHWLGAT